MIFINIKTCALLFQMLVGIKIQQYFNEIFIKAKILVSIMKICSYDLKDLPEISSLINICFKTKYDTAFFERSIFQRPGIDFEGSIIIKKENDIIANTTLTRRKLRFQKEELDLLAIDYVATHPNNRGKGLAKIMMNRSIDYAKENGLDGLFLSADPKYHARDIYSKIGFQEVEQASVAVRMTDYAATWSGFELPYKLLVLSLPLSKTRTIFHKKSNLPVKFADESDIDSFLINMKSCFNNNFGYASLSHEKWEWIKNCSINENFPIALMIMLNDEIIAGCRVSVFQPSFANINPFVGIISDIFATVESRKQQKQLMRNLVLQSIEILKEHTIPTVISIVSKSSPTSESLVDSGFFLLEKIAYMFYPLTQKLKDSLKRAESEDIPWYYIQEHLLGIP